MVDFRRPDHQCHCLFPASVQVEVLVVLFSLYLGGTHAVLRELADTIWVGLVVCSCKQSIHNPKKGAYECARIFYIVLGVDSSG